MIWQFCMEMMRFQSWYFQLKNGTPVFSKMFSFFKKFVLKFRCWKRSKFSLIVTSKHANLSNGGLIWKSLESFFRRNYALFVDFKMKPIRETVKLAAESSNIHFTIYLMNYPFILLSIWWKIYLFSMWVSLNLFKKFFSLRCSRKKVKKSI